ncbi:MAG: transposase [Treponema sp. CETP13]|jgi:transposase|nr:MAG: transposase [Treponema sp. CETP13]
MEERRKRRTFDDDFKKKMVDLFNAGKPRAEIVREYELTASVLDRWITRINKTGSSKEADNRSDLENELLKLKKQNRQLQIENDILKQAALIFAQK